MDELVPGTDEGGSDRAANDYAASFLAALREHQEAVWAVVAHGRIVVRPGRHSSGTLFADRCWLHLPERFRGWWQQHGTECWSAVVAAAGSAWGWDEEVCHNDIVTDWILEIPPELVDFVARNTDRPRPRRYNSTAVTYVERDNIAWLTPPEVALYDAIRQAGWMMVPQPAFLEGEELNRRPDFLVFWQGRAEHAVLIEVDSDAFHPPSQRDSDEAKERAFQARGFQYLRFSAKRVLRESPAVLNEIRNFCTRKFGA